MGKWRLHRREMALFTIITSRGKCWLKFSTGLIKLKGMEIGYSAQKFFFLTGKKMSPHFIVVGGSCHLPSAQCWATIPLWGSCPMPLTQGQRPITQDWSALGLHWESHHPQCNSCSYGYYRRFHIANKFRQIFAISGICPVGLEGRGYQRVHSRL